MDRKENIRAGYLYSKLQSGDRMQRKIKRRAAEAAGVAVASGCAGMAGSDPRREPGNDATEGRINLFAGW